MDRVESEIEVLKARIMHLEGVIDSLLPLLGSNVEDRLTALESNSSSSSLSASASNVEDDTQLEKKPFEIIWEADDSEGFHSIYVPDGCILVDNVPVEFDGRDEENYVKLDMNGDGDTVLDVYCRVKRDVSGETERWVATFECEEGGADSGGGDAGGGGADESESSAEFRFKVNRFSAYKGDGEACIMASSVVCLHYKTDLGDPEAEANKIDADAPATAEVEVIPEDKATNTKEHWKFTFGIPSGKNGENGKDAAVDVYARDEAPDSTHKNGGTNVSLTPNNGGVAAGFIVWNGNDGENGKDGVDGKNAPDFTFQYPKEIVFNRDGKYKFQNHIYEYNSKTNQHTDINTFTDIAQAVALSSIIT